MPSKTKKVSVKTERSSNKKSEGFLSQIKWGESYTSLFLGAIVVIIALVLVFSFLKSRSVQQTGSTSTKGETETTYANGKPKTYTVKEGEDLWSISEKIYGSGYNWVDLAKTNKMENPGLVYVGAKLSVPNVEPKTLTTAEVAQPNPITGVSYTVAKGDDLWDIALRAYGDGYKWTQIAKANNLVNPNIIHPGNVLKLPR